MKEPELWQEGDLLALIRDKHEENIKLEFKRADALQTAEGKKSEIAKDVSAFANSAGGTILYGMEEDPIEPHSAAALSPIDPTACSKEWLEQVINSRIQPRIDGIVINCIKLDMTSPGKFAYAVVIPEGATAYQASDKRYYKRFNFQSVAMEDYEIRQTMNRTSRPAYKVTLVAKPSGRTGDYRSLARFWVTLENISEMVGRDVSAVIFAPAGRLIAHQDETTEYMGVPYARMNGVFNFLEGAIPSAYPIARYGIDFPQNIVFPSEYPFTAIVRVFDHYGLSLTASFKVEYADIKLERESHAAKRSPAALAIARLE